MSIQDLHEETRLAAESDLEKFIRLVHPQRVLGSVHTELIRWWTREDAKNYQLVLLPRDHQKSAMIAYRTAWEITKDPTLRVLYISSTSNLATKQLSFIKSIITSPIYKIYWPDMVNEDEGKREKWTESEISVDHPLRKAEAIRDPTIFTAGLTTSITGLHCDIAVLDDIVVKENAYTEDGREKTRMQYSLLSSIEGADAKEWVVGTRYHPKDLYNDLMGMEILDYNDDGTVKERISLYEEFTRQVEDSPMGDGTGQFLWPRQRRYDGKWYGFDKKILDEKKAKYLDKLQFRAQYYNDPNDPEGAGITREHFQYYNPEKLRRLDNQWYYGNQRLNLVAAIDFAYSMSKRSDYTAVTVIGVDASRNYYILDIDRFKADKISEYYNRILRLHQKWGFRKLQAEVTAAQDVIVKDLKHNYILKDGLSLAIGDVRPHRGEGNKEERIKAILQPRYEERMIWHYLGGHCSTLEEELILEKPPHDDLKDCLAIAIDGAVVPSPVAKYSLRTDDIGHHPRFGGIS